jgi:hypothetical protein
MPHYGLQILKVSCDLETLVDNVVETPWKYPEFNIYLFFHIHRPTSNEIPIANADEIDHSNDKHVSDDDDLSNDEQEKQFEEKLDEIDAIQQIQNNMIVPPGVAEMTPQTTTPSRRFHLLSKIP